MSKAEFDEKAADVDVIEAVADMLRQLNSGGYIDATEGAKIMLRAIIEIGEQVKNMRKSK